MSARAKGAGAAAARRPRPWRLVVQILFFALIAAISVNHGLTAAGKAVPLLSTASLHAVCPFGSLQEWIGKLGKKILGRRHNRLVPEKVDRWLRYLRDVVLAWVLYMTAATGVLVFEAWDPYWALFNFWTGEVAITGFLVLGLTLALSFLVERPFCAYACPYAALLGLFNPVRIFGIKRNPATCTSCRACDRACPMNTRVSGKEGRVRDHQCISCLECTPEKACPVGTTVVYGAGRFEPLTPRAASAETKEERTRSR